MKIKAVEPKCLALDYPKRNMYSSLLGLTQFEIRRMREGQEKYGTSWAEVDLQQDLIEELSDALNYLYLMFIRIKEALGEVPENIAVELVHIAKLLSDALNKVEFDLPSFEGPTSNEWAESRDD